MTIQEAINILQEEIIHEFTDVDQMDAWQTLKTFVSEQTAYNSAITKFCPHHIRNKQCIWGLRGCCSEAACNVRPELRK